MKCIAGIAVFVLIHMVDFSLQIPSLKNCAPDFLETSRLANSCGTVTCNEDGSFGMVGCGTWRCGPGKTLGYTETNNSKPFPDCCGGPICAE